MTFLLIYIINATTIKFSVLLLYYRIFKTRSFKNVIYVVSAAVLVWCITSFCVILFQCSPVNSFWITNQPRKCIDQYALFIGTAAGNSFLDIVILCLPIKVVWDLQMPVSKRIQVIFTFILGAL